MPLLSSLALWWVRHSAKYSGLVLLFSCLAVTSKVRDHDVMLFGCCAKLNTVSCKRSCGLVIMSRFYVKLCTAKTTGAYEVPTSSRVAQELVRFLVMMSLPDCCSRSLWNWRRILIRLVRSWRLTAPECHWSDLNSCSVLFNSWCSECYYCFVYLPAGVLRNPECSCCSVWVISWWSEVPWVLVMLCLS